MSEVFWNEEDHPEEQMGIRRHTDRCFHSVEEELPEGYIVQGILISRDEVAEVRIVPRDSGGDTCGLDRPPRGKS